MQHTKRETRWKKFNSNQSPFRYWILHADAIRKKTHWITENDSVDNSPQSNVNRVICAFFYSEKKRCYTPNTLIEIHRHLRLPGSRHAVRLCLSCDASARFTTVSQQWNNFVSVLTHCLLTYSQSHCTKLRACDETCALVIRVTILVMLHFRWRPFGKRIKKIFSNESCS